jgi:hypothetical protein
MVATALTPGQVQAQMIHKRLPEDWLTAEAMGERIAGIAGIPLPGGEASRDGSVQLLQMAGFLEARNGGSELRKVGTSPEPLPLEEALAREDASRGDHERQRIEAEAAAVQAVRDEMNAPVIEAERKRVAELLRPEFDVLAARIFDLGQQLEQLRQELHAVRGEPVGS